MNIYNDFQPPWFSIFTPRSISRRGEWSDTEQPHENMRKHRSFSQFTVEDAIIVLRERGRDLGNSSSFAAANAINTCEKVLFLFGGMYEWEMTRLNGHIYEINERSLSDVPDAFSNNKFTTTVKTTSSAIDTKCYFEFPRKIVLGNIGYFFKFSV